MKKKDLNKKGETNKLTQSVIKLLSREGFVVWRNNNGAVYDVTRRCFRANSTSKLGVPDIIGYQKLTGRGIYVEIKTGYDRLSDEQRAFLKEALENGCIAFECRTIDDVPRRLKLYNYK